MIAARVRTVLVALLLLSSCGDDPAPAPAPAPAPDPTPAPDPAAGTEPPPEGAEGAEEPEARALSAGTLRLIESLPDGVEITFVVARHLPDWYQGWEHMVDEFAPLYEEAGLTVRILHPRTVPERAGVERMGILEAQREVAAEGGGTQALVYHRGFAVRAGERVVAAREAPDPWWLEYEVARRLRAVAEPPLVLGVADLDGPSIREATDCLERFGTEEIDLSEPIDATAISALVIVQPGRRLTRSEVENLTRYLDGGGSVGIFGANVQASYGRWESRDGSVLDVGLGPVLEPWGVTLHDQMVMAESCSQARVEVGGIEQLADFRAMPIAAFPDSGMHPALNRGTMTRMPFAGAFTLEEREGVTQELVLHAREAWLADVPSDLSPATRDELEPPEDGTTDELPLLAFLRKGDARLLIAGSSFIRDDLIREDGCFNPERNADLNPRVHFVRMVDWLGLDADLVDIGAPEGDQPQAF